MKVTNIPPKTCVEFSEQELGKLVVEAAAKHVGTDQKHKSVYFGVRNNPISLGQYYATVTF